MVEHWAIGSVGTWNFRHALTWKTGTPATKELDDGDLFHSPTASTSIPRAPHAPDEYYSDAIVCSSLSGKKIKYGRRREQTAVVKSDARSYARVADRHPQPHACM